MEIEFVNIRIGKYRKDNFAEAILIENTILLKQALRTVLRDVEVTKFPLLYLDIIVPGRGSQIKFSIDHIKNQTIRNLLLDNFPDSIYSRDYSMWSQNCYPQTFNYNVYSSLLNKKPKLKSKYCHL